jgi:hypothetical protein
LAGKILRCYNPGMSETWLEVARESRTAARHLMLEDNFRSCVSRSYYAAYSKVTHELASSAGLTMPQGREGPHHTGSRGAIRRMVETSMPNMRPDKRGKLSELIGRLYTLRLDADYKPSSTVEGREAREAMSMMNKVFGSF